MSNENRMMDPTTFKELLDAGEIGLILMDGGHNLTKEQMRQVKEKANEQAADLLLKKQHEVASKPGYADSILLPLIRKIQEGGFASAPQTGTQNSISAPVKSEILAKTIATEPKVKRIAEPKKYAKKVISSDEKKTSKALSSITSISSFFDFVQKENSSYHEQMQDMEKNNNEMRASRHKEIMDVLIKATKNKTTVEKKIKKKIKKVEEPKVEAKPPAQAGAPKVETKPTTPAKTETPKVETKPPAQAGAPKVETKPTTPAKTETPKVETKPPAQAEKPKVETKPVTQAEKPKVETKPPAQAEKPKVEARKPKVETKKETAAPAPKPEAPVTAKPQTELPPPPGAATKMPAKKGATASKISKAELAGRAAQFATGLIGLGITSSAAIAGIISTSAKESQLDPTSGELGGQAWLNTLNKGPKQVNNKTISALQYVHLKLPQLGPGGRVATALGFPNGVPEDYIRNVISKGDEEWFKFIYPDGYKYRGRGFIQITGKASYQAVGNLIGIDLIKDPDLVTKDYDTAVKAAGAYTMIALGKGDPKKGLSILNSFTDEEEARKWIVANVAAGRTGFDIAIRNKVLSDPTGRSQLEKATENASLGSTAASEALNKLSTENADMRKSMAQGSGAPQVLQVNNNSTQKKVIQLPDNKPRELNPTMQ